MEKLSCNNLSKEQKLRLTMMIIAYGLVFYVVGVVTNFFGSPIFSMFFIIDSNIVHGVLIYVALAVAVALSATNLTLALIQRRKLELPQIHDKLTIRIMKTPDETLAGVSMPTKTLKKAGNPENSKVEQKSQQPTQPAMRPTNQSTVQKASQPYIVKNTTSNQEAGMNEKKGRLTCPTCKKEFSTPLLTLDYAASTPKLIRHCPYCDQSID
jgi:uncharacterized Zn-finger protein